MLKITPLQTGWIPADPRIYWFHSGALPYKELPARKVDLPAFSFLIEGGEKLMLVDTGMPDADKANRTHAGTHAGARQPQDMTLSANLKRLGYAPDDIELVFFTHLHWDHVGGLPVLHKAKLAVSAAELNFANHPIPPYYKSYDYHIAGECPPFAGREFRTLAKETELMPGVTVFPTPGHTLGHWSASVDTASGTFCICGDALFLPENLDPIDQLGWSCVSPGKVCDLVASWHSVEEIGRRFPNKSRLLISHDIGLAQRLTTPAV